MSDERDETSLFYEDEDDETNDGTLKIAPEEEFKRAGTVLLGFFLIVICVGGYQNCGTVKESQVNQDVKTTMPVEKSGAGSSTHSL